MTTARFLVAAWIAGSAPVSGAALAAAADSTAGARLATLCAPCHRLDGRYAGIASVTRWEAEEIVDKMHAFRSGERTSTVMRAVSLSLSDDEIASVAEYLAALGRKGNAP